MLSPDIVRKVQNDFRLPDEAELVLAVLKDFAGQNQRLSGDRMLRCIVYIANGDLERLDKALDLAKVDYRDLIVWAEYDHNFYQVRDLSVPFDK